MDKTKMDYATFKKSCQENETYKKAKAIAEKYGYEVPELCYVDDGNIRFFLRNKRDRYLPEIYYGAKFGGDKYEFEIQTTSYGALSLVEHADYIKSITDAHNMVKELMELDFMTLEHVPAEEEE